MSTAVMNGAGDAPEQHGEGLTGRVTRRLTGLEQVTRRLEKDKARQPETPKPEMQCPIDQGYPIASPKLYRAPGSSIDEYEGT